MRHARLSDLDDEYRTYLLEVRSMSEGSLPRRLWIFRRLVRFLAEKRVRSARRVSLALAYEFLERCARGNSRRHAKSCHDAVRLVFKFLHFTGRLREDLARHMIAPCVWKLADVSMGFSGKEIPLMLSSLRSETPYDHRERLVMQLFISYGLRHTFAVHRLLKWYEEGVDVNTKLPLLATYMGHTHYRHTQKYLTVLPTIIDMAGKRFAEMFEKPLRDLERPDGQ